MFLNLFLFELQSRLRRPAIYVYFAILLALTLLCFAEGAVPAGEKEHLNSPYLIAQWFSIMSMLMMLIVSSMVGTALYRDIESDTHSYYLTYPISRAGYFWGRFSGSFACLLLTSLAIPAGIYLGSLLGPALAGQDKGNYGPNQLSYYLQPFFYVALPNLLFTSSLFFGLVALTRNVKVIYTGGLILFLAYFLAIFFLAQTHNEALINLADAFGLTNIRNHSGGVSAAVKNSTVFPITGPFLLNRILWPAIGLLVLAFAWYRFSFSRFFSGRNLKAQKAGAGGSIPPGRAAQPQISFDRTYNRRTLSTLFRLELSNLFRDNYFWIIIGSGLLFLVFIFSAGTHTNGVPDLPRTIEFLQIDPFFMFIFFLIVFYSGEILHRDRHTRYAVIGDSLPPPTWVLNASKLLALLFLACCLAFLPLLTGVPVQLAKGFSQIDLPVYLHYILTITLPKLLEMVVFGYAVHVLVNNKFAGHAVAIFLWLAVFFLRDAGIFDYNLLLYSYTPDVLLSDMDGLGHMAGPIHWFTVYWLFGGGLLAVIAALFYYRGISSSFRERLRVVPGRFSRPARIATGMLLAGLLLTGGYIYYNVSYLNVFLTGGERESRAVTYEKVLKPYASLPLPRITRVNMQADLYPDRAVVVNAELRVVNKNDRPIESLLMDADELSAYTLKQDKHELDFTCPLTYPRAVFSFFRPQQDTAEFRLYRLKRPLAPGDSTVLEIRAAISPQGFSNSEYTSDRLHNGTFIKGLLPNFGYDENEELSDRFARKKNGLAPKADEEDRTGDAPEAVNSLREGKTAGLVSLELTISTSGDQTAVAPGALTKTWHKNGRNYFHYRQDRPGIYGQFAVLSARYATLQDSVRLPGGQGVNVRIFYHPGHPANVQRFMSAYRDGLRYFSTAWGDYPFRDIRLAETPGFGEAETSMPTLGVYSERFGWNADLRGADPTDYCYFETARNLAEQWWRFQVAPNATQSAWIIPDGLSRYGALKLAESKYGANNIKGLLEQQLGTYLFLRNRLHIKEVPMLYAKEDRWGGLAGKAGILLYELSDLAGDDRINAALKEFLNAYAFKKEPPYAGSADLHRILKKHVPDSLQYYLRDNWEKVTLYNNQVNTLRAVPTGKNGDYRVTLQVNVAKVYLDSLGNETLVKTMNDLIDIGVFAADTRKRNGSVQSHPLALSRYRLSAGTHTIQMTVHGKPAYGGIDPLHKLADKRPEDNVKNFK
jgi:ABC-type transport system involved in multi-copper enzyme maturation permease subunit